MRTIVGLANSNCSWCLKVMEDRLAARPLVHAVHLDFTAGCLVVDHHDDDPAALVAEIHDDLRGWTLADNGEAVMVDLGVHEEDECRRAATTSGHEDQRRAETSGRNTKGTTTVNGTDGALAAGIGSYRSAVRFDPDRPVVANVVSYRATTVFVVCLDVGQELAEHLAPDELTLLIIEGQPTVTVEGEINVTAAGDVVVMAAGAPHSLSAGAAPAVVVGVLQARQ